MKTSLLIAAGLALLSLCGRVSADGRTAQVDALFGEWNRSDSPGCSIAIFQQGEIVYEHGYGMADLDHGIANTPTTVFHIASVSKQFTAASVVLLAQEGKLSLDDPVRKYLPELPDFGTPITIRQLLHHTSGLRDQWELLALSGWRDSQDLVTDDDVMSLVKRQRALNFVPGSKYSYSNTGYTLLAQIVQRVSGKSFREFAAERLFRPLGMKATHFRDDFTEIVPGMAYGYVRSGDVFKTSVTNFNTVGATSLLTTVEDLARWDRNFYDAKVGGEALVNQMVERGVLNDGKQLDYALGLNTGAYRGLPTVGHSGSDAGYLAYLVRFPEQRFGVACLCNSADVSPEAISRKIADIYLADLLKPASVSAEKPATQMSRQEIEPAPPYVPSAQALAQYAGTYVSEEIELPYRISFGDGVLLVTSMKMIQGLALKPLAPNLFSAAGIGKLRFTRDGRGQISGFVINSGRIVDFRFTKRDPR